ncbi:MAG: hypothetical protein ACXWM8_08780 [Candidatus Limnocylindrales bacterium]
MSLQLHRPDGSGGLVPTPPPARAGRRGRDEDWRDGLKSPRWRVPALSNSEMNPTSTLAAVAFWAVLALLTFGLLLWGYGTHFWH